jgi:chitin disaccharide deacetylase
VTRPATLAERLGYPNGSRLLIVNADDFGSHHGANVAIIQAFGHGSITSASLMVPCPWAAGAARDSARAAAEGVAVDIGVHLTVTSEWIDYRWAGITRASVLHGTDGRMHRSSAEFHAAIADAGPRGMAAVRAECAAQIELALAWDVDVTHLDGHMGVMYSSAALIEIVVDLAAEHRLPVRMVSPSQERALGFECRRRATERGVLFPDNLVETYIDARPHHDRVLASLRAGVTEILLHPSVDTADLRAAYADADERVANYTYTLPGGGLLASVAEHGTQLLGYRALRELQRSVA